MKAVVERRTRTLAVVSGVAFIALVAASNWLTARYGLIGGFVAAGTFTAGLVLAARDAVRETAGIAWVFACIAAGAALSAVMTYAAGTFPGGPTPLRLATASGIAFGLSEIADHFVYEPLRTTGQTRALAWSNAVGSVVDSFLFLALAGFPLWPAVAGQVAIKWVVAVALPVLALGVWRVVLRHRVRPAGS